MATSCATAQVLAKASLFARCLDPVGRYEKTKNYHGFPSVARAPRGLSAVIYDLLGSP